MSSFYVYQSTRMNLPERFYLTQKIDSVAVIPWLILLFSDVYLKYWNDCSDTVSRVN